MPTWSVTVRPWKFTLPIGKDRLPNHHGFQGQTVKLVGCNYSIKQKYTTKNIPSSTCWDSLTTIFWLWKNTMGVAKGQGKIHQTLRWFGDELGSTLRLAYENGTEAQRRAAANLMILFEQDNGRRAGPMVGWLVGWLVWENWSNLMGCLFYALVVVMEWSWFDEIEIWGAYSSWEIFKNDKLFSWSELV